MSIKNNKDSLIMTEPMEKSNSKLYSVVIAEWLKIHSLKTTASTMYNYEKTANKIIQYFQEESLDKITSAQIQNFIIFLNDNKFTENTIINYCKVLHMSLEYAVDKEYIPISPYRGIILPKKECAEITPFSEEEVIKLLSIPMTEWMHDAIILAYKTGMRKGEIFALKKDDIDFENGFLMVRRTQSTTKYEVILKAPKTKASRRRIDLDSNTLEILKHRCEASTSEFVFSWSSGEMIIPWNIAATIKRKCKIAGIQEHRFHDLRHGHATYLLINNVHPKIVQERMGHSNVGITLDTYSHLIPGMQKTAVNAVSKLNF